MDEIIPDYAGGSIVNLMRSIEVAHNGGSSYASSKYPELTLLGGDELSACERTVLFVIDGLGYHRLMGLGDGSHLGRHVRGTMTSVFPSTTASAVTSFFTGVGPLQHGLTGWHLWCSVAGEMITPLPFVSRLEGSVLGDSAREVFHSPPLAARLPVACHAVLPDYICDSVYSAAHTGPSRRWPFEGLEGMFDQVLDILRQPGPAFVHAYWPDFDATSHKYGTWSAAADDALRSIDTAFGQFLDACASGNTTVLLTADHGFIDSPPPSRLSLNDYPELAAMLALPICGEPRVAYCYPRPGCETDLNQFVDENLGFAFARKPAADLLAANYFGVGAAHPQFEERIGAQVLIARENYVIGDGLSDPDTVSRLTGFHGGVSAAEMRVPLVFVQP